ncbi:MAG: hypothetical protein ABI222_02590 [Opitutaceae bacterium]
MNADTHLRAIKAVHTVIWAFFAGCVLAIPFQAWRGNFGCVLVLIGFVGLEIVILAFNSGHCPLTGIAARYTRERRGNFDIYLPEWLASRTKIIFGPLFLVGLIIAAALRWGPRP